MMQLREWNARLHGLVVFRALLGDPVVAKLAALTDRLEAADDSIAPLCDAVAAFEAALFAHTTNLGDYLSNAVLETETFCVRQAAAGQLSPVMEAALNSELNFLQKLCGLTLDALLEAADRQSRERWLPADPSGRGSGRARNIAVYATSNRRHLIKETLTDRTGDDIHEADTRQELMSLSARFGLTVTFQRPEKARFETILAELAKQHGIDMPMDQLLVKAEAFAIRAGGRSPRVAKQFIEQCEAGVQK